LIRLSRRKIPVGLTLLAVHASLLAVLAVRFVHRRWSGILLLALAGSILLLFLQRRRVAASAWIVLLAIALGMLHFNSWWFTLIGDEASFWRVAREIVQHPSVRDIGSHLFRLEGGVFGSTPYVSSLIQAVGMLIAGANNFGWKFSNIYLCAFAIVFFFRFYRTFAGKSVAVLACLFLAGSHYLMSFGKIGYSSLHAYLAIALCSAHRPGLSGRAARSPSRAWDSRWPRALPSIRRRSMFCRFLSFFSSFTTCRNRRLRFSAGRTCSWLF
jgi:hypothetical protein